MFWKKRIYLDYAAGAEGNPSSPHAEGRAAKRILEDARAEIARLVEVKADDIIFTSGATEANAIAILGIAKADDHALYLPSAHASIVENMKLLAERGVTVEPLSIRDGKVDCEKLKELLRPETKLVAMEAVCGETGTIWNTREVKNILPPRAFLHVDASQAPLTQKISRSHFAADTLAFDSAKVAGPRGIGCLVAHRTIAITPLYRGGGQERGLRSGTENPEAAEDFAAMLDLASFGREALQARAAQQRALLLSHIADIPNLSINAGRESVPYILNISLSGRDTDYLVALLDEGGFAVSTRSACETDSEEGSRAVFALTGDSERAKSTLRISWGPDISALDLRRFARELVLIVAFVDSAAAR